MKLQVALALCAIVASTFAEEKFERLGQMCTVGVFPLPASEPSKFLSCAKPSGDNIEWPWEQVGVWTETNCADGKLFSMEDRMCKNERTVRRQQANYCARFPTNCPFQPDPCEFRGGCNQQVALPPLPPPPPPPPPPQPMCGPPPAPPCQPFQPIIQSCGPPPAPPCQPVQPIIQSCGPPPAPPCQPIRPIVQSCGPPPAPPCRPPPRPVCGGIRRPACPPVPKPCPMASGCGGGGGGCGGGAMCSWMMERLRPGGQGYRQCVPAQNPRSPYCGRWISRPCGPGTRFDARLQVCIADPRSRMTCGGPAIPIGPCNQRSACPGQSRCFQPTRTCCQSV